MKKTRLYQLGVVMLLQHFHRHPVPQIVRLELGVADAAFGRAE
jgi:hypothetical protein